VLDCDVVSSNNDALYEQTHESLTALEVEVAEASAQSGGEGLEIVPESVEPSAVHLLASELVDASTGSIA
jgi:hypothetical protein